MLTRKKMENYLSHLKEQHNTLNQQIDKMESSGAFEDQKIIELKKKRLLLKDNIEKNAKRIDDLK